MELTVLEYIQKMIKGTLKSSDSTYMRYPSAISETLEMTIVAAKEGEAKVSIHADSSKHGNQQGTVHGGLICELADAAMGVAHSTIIQKGESFTSIEFKINFFRPVWKERLIAHTTPIQQGRTITVYRCEVIKENGKLAAMATSTVMTLRGEQAKGR